MRTTPIGFEVWRFPEGEEALSFLERVCREAYQSEGLIDDGKDDREPSSHKLLRRILKLNRRERLAKKVEKQLWRFPDDMRNSHGLARQIVNLCLDKVRDDPPHTAVLDHLHATVRIVAGRGVTHEWVRHRIGWGYLQRSTRWVGGGRSEEGIEVIERTADDFEGGELARVIWEEGISDAERAFNKLLETEKNQMARGNLPIDVAAPLVATGSFSAWHHFFRMRLSPAAHPDMHRICRPLLADFQSRIPLVFDVPGLI